MNDHLLLQLEQSLQDLSSIQYNFLFGKPAVVVLHFGIEGTFVAEFRHKANIPLSLGFRFLQEIVEEVFVILAFGVLVDDLFEFGDAVAFVQYLEHQIFGLYLLECFGVGADRTVVAPFLIFRRVPHVGKHLHHVEVPSILVWIVRDQPALMDSGARAAVLRQKSHVAIDLPLGRIEGVKRHPVAVEDLEI